MKPIRVVRQYYKALPPNTKSVTRPGRFGNPFKLSEGKIYILSADKKDWNYLGEGDIDTVLNLFKSVLTGNMASGEYNFQGNNFSTLLHWTDYFEKLDYSVLEGQNLACFCKLKQKCHADILLDFVYSRRY